MICASLSGLSMCWCLGFLTAHFFQPVEISLDRSTIQVHLFQIQYLFYFLRFLFGPSSILPESLWVVVLPFITFTVLPNLRLRSLATLMKVHSISTCRSLINLQNLTSPSAEPRGIHIELPTGHPPLPIQQDFCHLLVHPWAVLV